MITPATTAPPPRVRRLEIESARLGAASAASRLLRRPGLGIAVATLGLSAVAGSIERAGAEAGAIDRSLSTVFRLVIPLATFALVGLLTGKHRLEEASGSLSRFGADRRFVTFGQVAMTAAFAAALAAVATTIGVVVAHGPPSGPLVGELFACAWIAALTAVAYTSWFSLGATFFRFGGGRAGVLFVDFVLGASGLLAWIAPRGLALNLLGLTTSDLPQRGASALLAATAILAALTAAARSGR